MFRMRLMTASAAAALLMAPAAMAQDQTTPPTGEDTEAPAESAVPYDDAQDENWSEPNAAPPAGEDAMEAESDEADPMTPRPDPAMPAEPMNPPTDMDAPTPDPMNPAPADPMDTPTDPMETPADTTLPTPPIDPAPDAAEDDLMDPEPPGV